MKIKLIDFNGPAPKRAHDNDAGADVFSPKDQTIYPGQVYKFPLGFGLELAIAERFMRSSPMSATTGTTSRRATVSASL